MLSFTLLLIVASIQRGFLEGDKDLRPRDPVMDQVANILKGILSNLSKHKTLVQVGKEVAKAKEEELSKLPASQRGLVLGELRKQLASLGKDDTTIKSLIGDDVSAHKELRQALVSTVWHLAPTTDTFRSAAGINGSGFVLFVEPECQYSTSAEKEVKKMQTNTKIVNASTLFLDGFVDRAPELYYVAEGEAQPRRFEGNFSNSDLAEFYKSTAAGTVEKRDTRVLTSVKHGSVPKVSSDDVQAKFKEDKDVFVVFYSPMCGHCQTFVLAADAPLDVIGNEVTEVGAAAKLDVVAVDVSKQTFVPEVFPTIQYVPAMFLVPGDHSKAIPYTGSHDPQEIMKFIEDNAVHAKDALKA